MKILEILEIDLFKQTDVDGLVEGNTDQECKKVVVTFLATMEILKKSLQIGANFIISHEGIYYSHDNKKFLENSKLAQEKQDYIKKHNLTIYRHHDMIHRILPDTITEGLVKQLDLADRVITQSAYYTISEISPTYLKDYVEKVKETLEVSTIKHFGEDNQIINKVCVLVGYRGSSDNLIPVIENQDVDLIIYGEGPEWEIPYYIKDYNTLNSNKKSLIIIGHEVSEKYGMQMFMHKLKQKFPTLEVTYL